MEIKTVKVINKLFSNHIVNFKSIIGIYQPDKVVEALDICKKQLLEKQWTLTSESKDCCNYTLEFTNEDEAKIMVTTTDYILNELKEE